MIGEKPNDGPMLRLTVPDAFGEACYLRLSWSGGPRPLALSIRPANYAKDPEGRDTVVDLTRDDMRLLRDCFDSFLRSPDLRLEVKAVSDVP